ncbi:unnamed protein product [Clonostachys rosea f. rosea IK726]|uniref:catechol O-methyltransferase n=2 Tax=Bionectria ochroleuca TaxID=29856 RepID=A0A0B7JNH8_BIOOC|nr:unnamed protein product [Clonostachys rosea f. rosea IK726]
MSQFYKPEEEVFCNDGREQQLLAGIQSHPNLSTMMGVPERVLEAIDDFGRNHDFLMNVGQAKGSIVSRKIAEKCPTTMVELGGYVGYSAIMFGDAVRRAGGKKYISLEKSEEFAAVARSLLAIAGLDDFVEVRVGPCDASLRQLRQEQPELQIDLLFLDHQKSAYVYDLMLCEELSLVRSGSLVIADNVISPGAPGYLEYVRGTKAERTTIRNNIQTNQQRPGSSENDELAYLSELLASFEPTGEPDGLEISFAINTAE